MNSGERATTAFIVRAILEKFPLLEKKADSSMLFFYASPPSTFFSHFAHCHGMFVCAYYYIHVKRISTLRHRSRPVHLFNSLIVAYTVYLISNIPYIDMKSASAKRREKYPSKKWVFCGYIRRSWWCEYYISYNMWCVPSSQRQHFLLIIITIITVWLRP